MSSESVGYTVLAGYISPCHPSYLYQKLGYECSDPAACIPGSTRNHLIELGIQDDPTWMLDSYMSSTDKFIPNDQVLSDFRRRVDEHIGSHVEIGWVVGTDNFSSMYQRQLEEERMQLIVVENRDIDSKESFIAK